MNQRIEESTARFQPNHRQEQHNTDLTQGQVGTRRHKPIKLADGTDTRQDNRHNQRAACQTQFQRHWHTRNGNRNRAEQDTEQNTDEHRQHLYLLQFFLRVTDYFNHRINRLCFAHQIEYVTKLQSHVARRHQFDTRTVQARNHDIVLSELTDFFAKCAFMRHHHTNRAQSRALGS